MRDYPDSFKPIVIRRVLIEYEPERDQRPARSDSENPPRTAVAADDESACELALAAD